MKLDAGDIAELAPIIREAVKAVLDELQADDAKIGSNGRIGFTEVEAAGLLGIQPYVLGDARRRGEISAVKIGKQYVYSRTSLVRYLDRKQ